MKLVSLFLQLAFFTLLTLSQAVAASDRDEDLLRRASNIGTPHDVRIVSIEGLTESKDPKIINFLKATAQDSFVHPEVRVAAIRALRSPTDPSVKRVLETIVDNGRIDPTERAAALRSLRGIEEFRRN